MSDQPETFRVYKVTIPLQVSDVYAVPTRFYEFLNELNRMCELCTFSQIQSHTVWRKFLMMENFDESGLGKI